jgi:hypothetical protein
MHLTRISKAGPASRKRARNFLPWLLRAALSQKQKTFLGHAEASDFAFSYTAE